MIRFLLNQEPIRLAVARADITVLQWLREHKLKTGTKEGCGSGDCGACTVVLASLVERQGAHHLHYESINSCITFVGALHGKQLITVEDLAQGRTLHPVQAAMVAEHGSQCGFCTPGFIMSMFALYHSENASTLADDPHAVHQSIAHSLGGNLCRCTGYAPIKRATLSALQTHRADQFDAHAEHTISTLLEFERQWPMHPRFLSPATLQELGTLRIQYPDARLLAGGTDLALEVTQQLKDIDTIIYLKHVPELLRVTTDNGELRLGAAVSITRCMQAFADSLPASRAMLLRFGSEQVRNQATLGGNIVNASPVGDLPPLLLALDATLVLHRGDEQRSLNINDFYLAYKKTALQADEFLQAVHVPIPSTNTKLCVFKVSKRMDDDISTVLGVFCLQLDKGKVAQARVAFGGMAATPARAAHVERALLGRPLDEAAVSRAIDGLGHDFSPISDARASADYRHRVACNLIKRCKLELGGAEACVQVSDYVSG